MKKLAKILVIVALVVAAVVLVSCMRPANVIL